MTAIRVVPGPVSGTIRAPPSKSYTHRALVAAHLARRRYRIDHPLRSDDTRATAQGIRALGSEVEFGRDRWTVSPVEPRRRGPLPTIDCRESGTTLRLLTAIAALSDRPVRFRGQGRLPLRPISPLLRALASVGARIQPIGRKRSLPLSIVGPIHGGRIRLDASGSSQFVSALLFALPVVEPRSSLTIVGRRVSQPYVEATLSVLRAHRIEIFPTASGYRIPGTQAFDGSHFEVPGDASSASYLLAAAAVSGGSVTVRGIDPRWPQADLGILDLLERYGARVIRSRGGITVGADRRRPFRASFTNAPDLFPLAGVLAASAPGVSRLSGAEHLAGKESDRRTETVRLVRRMGARATVSGSTVAIEGRARPRSFRLRGARDHRIVMSAAVGALAASGACELSEAQAVRKSFPEFFTVLGELTGPWRVA